MVGGAVAVEMGLGVDLAYAEAQTEAMSGEARKEALQLLKYVYENTKEIRDKFSKIGNGPVGGKDKAPIVSGALQKALENRPALQKMEITDMKIVIEKTPEALFLILILKGKNGMSRLVVPGKPVRR